MASETWIFRKQHLPDRLSILTVLRFAIHFDQGDLRWVNV